MKGCLVVLGFLAVGLAVFWGVLNLAGAKGDEEQRAYTVTAVRVETTGSEPEDNYAYRQHAGYRVSYSYRVGRDWYASSEWFGDEAIEALLVCTKPDDPADHLVARLRGDERCGRTDFTTKSPEPGTPVSGPLGEVSS